MHLDDEQLVRRAASGDAEAFGQLVGRYKASVHAYILSRIGDFAWAEDIAQETFIAAFTGLRRLREPGRFGAWLRAIADNMCALWFRRAERDERLRQRTVAMHEHRLDEKEAALPLEEVVLDALALLSPRDAAALTLYYCDGLTQRECAEFLGVSTKAVESRLYRARRRLREEVIGMAERTLKDHSPDDSFDAGVLEEIKRLVEVVGADYKRKEAEPAEERLRLLFSRNEERLADLIRNASSALERRAAMRMVRVLGTPGVNRALALALGKDEQARVNALSALATWEQGAFTYVVLEAIHEAAFPDEQKVEVLIELIRRPTLLAHLWPRAVVKRFVHDSTIYMEMLVRYGLTAVKALSEQIRADVERAGKALDPWLARALVRFGTEGVEPVVPWVETGPEDLTLAGMKLISTLTDGLYQFRSHARSHLSRTITEGDLFLLARGTTPPIVHPSRLAPEAMRGLGESVARAIKHPLRGVRREAAAALGHFDDEIAFPQILEALESPDVGVASAAAVSLGRRCSARRVEPLVRALETAPIPVKRAAYNSLWTLWTDSHALSHFRSDRESPEAANTTRFLAAEHELEALVSALDDNRSRLWAPLAEARSASDLRKSEKRSLAQRGGWKQSLDQMINLLVEGNRRRRERDRQVWEQSELYRRAREYHRKHPEVMLGPGGFFVLNLPAVVRVMPEDREYREKELTRIISRVNSDYSLARRRLYEEGWMTRTGDRYQFTQRGRRAWRVEHLLAETQKAFD